MRWSDGELLEHVVASNLLFIGSLICSNFCVISGAWALGIQSQVAVARMVQAISEQNQYAHETHRIMSFL